MTRVRNLKVILIYIAYLLCAWFIANPDPFPMALFVFVAQPLIFLAIILYVSEVLRELKQRGIL